MDASSRRWSLEWWIAVIAAVIAVASLILNLVQYSSSRTQERLTVQPHFQITFLWDDTGMGWITSNTGTGPARIRGFEILLDGKPLPYGQTFLVIASALELNFAGATLDFRNVRVGVLLKPDFSEHLFWAHKGPTEDKLAVLWNRITFKTCYCSIYDDCWIASNLMGNQGKDPQDNNCSAFQDQPHTPWWNG